MKRTVGIALLLVAGLLVAIALVWGGDRSQASVPPVSQDVINALTVRTVSVKCTTLSGVETVKAGNDTVVKYDVGALKGTPPRKWSDAISTSLVGSNAAQKLENLQASVCVDPLTGSTAANMLANLRVGNVSVGSLNPWLSPFQETSRISATAAGFIPLLDVKHPTSAQTAAAVKQNLAWQAVAERIDTLLTRFHLTGIETLQSVENWHLVAGGLVVGGLPEVGLNPQQEKLPALVLSVTEKGACAPLKVIGFNVGDKRPEVFATPVCTKSSPKPTTPSHPATTPPTTPSHPVTTPSPTPSSTPTPTPSPTCTPSGVTENCGKDARLAPSQPPVVSCPGGYMDRTTQKCVTGSYSPTPTPSTSTTGQGDSGPGATNTVSPPPTTAPAPTPSITTSPPSPVATPSL